MGIIGAIQAIGVLGEKGRNHLINTDGMFYTNGQGSRDGLRPPSSGVRLRPLFDRLFGRFWIYLEIQSIFCLEFRDALDTFKIG